MKRIIALFFGTILTCGVGPTHVSVAVGDAEVLTAGLRVRQHSGGDLVRHRVIAQPPDERTCKKDDYDRAQDQLPHRPEKEIHIGRHHRQARSDDGPHQRRDQHGADDNGR